jgi:hypothetical protein
MRLLAGCRIARAAALGVALTTAACATPRLHSSAELISLAARCELPPEDFAQDADLKKVLFLFTAGASEPQVACVQKWARRHRLHLAYIETIERAAP